MSGLATLVSYDPANSHSLPAAVILFIFAVTSGSIQGWATAYVLAPLIISVLLLIAFFVWEAHIDENDAAMYVLPSPFHLAQMLMFFLQSAIAMETSECTSPRGRCLTTLLLVDHRFHPGHCMV